MIELTDHPRGVLILVRASAGARRSGVLGERAGALHVAVSAAPEQGKANEALARTLADALGVRPSQVTLVKGHTSKRKLFLIEGMAKAEAAARLATLTAAVSPPKSRDPHA